MVGDRALGDAGAAFRLCDVRRGRLHAGANACHGGAYPIRDRRADGGALDVHRRYSRRDRRDRGVVLGCRHPPCRRAPWRRSRERRSPSSIPARSRRLRLRSRSGGGSQACSRLRDQRRRLPGDASRCSEPALRPRQPQAQDRRRRDAGHHAVLLRQRRHSCASSSEPGRPVSRFRSSPGSCPSRTSRERSPSLDSAARVSLGDSRVCSTTSTAIRRLERWSLRPLRPSNAPRSGATASTSSTSTRSTGPSSPSLSAACSVSDQRFRPLPRSGRLDVSREDQ